MCNILGTVEGQRASCFSRRSVLDGNYCGEFGPYLMNGGKTRSSCESEVFYVVANCTFRNAIPFSPAVFTTFSGILRITLEDI